MNGQVKKVTKIKARIITGITLRIIIFINSRVSQA